MILVTVGTQLGFDRLIRAMDRIAPGLPLPVFAQIGRGDYAPRNMQAQASISPSEFDRIIAGTVLIVAHAGIGTVLTAQKFNKPIVLFPRRAKLGEHRNDHQLATAKELNGRPGILVTFEEDLLEAVINQGLSMASITAEPSVARERLKHAVHSFIRGEGF